MLRFWQFWLFYNVDVLIPPPRALSCGWIYSGEQEDARAPLNIGALLIDRRCQQLISNDRVPGRSELEFSKILEYWCRTDVVLCKGRFLNLYKSKKTKHEHLHSCPYSNHWFATSVEWRAALFLATWKLDQHFPHFKISVWVWYFPAGAQGKYPSLRAFLYPFCLHPALSKLIFIIIF